MLFKYIDFIIIMSESEEEFKRANNNLNKENVSNSLRVSKLFDFNNRV